MGDFNNMFYSAGSFNQAVNGWVVTNTASSDDTEKGMAGMFQNAQSFNQDVDSWTPTSVEKFENMFKGASRFDGKIFDQTNAAVTMTSMFEGASSFTGKNAENMVTNTVQDMQSMFQSATVFNAVIDTDVTDTNKWKVTAVTTFANMFKDASTFNQNIANWEMRTATDAAGLATMFDGASNFQQNLCDWNEHVGTGGVAVPGMFSSPNKCPQADGNFIPGTTNSGADTKACCTCDSGEGVCA